MYDFVFENELKKSQECKPAIEPFLQHAFGTTNLKVATTQEDINGIDYWATISPTSKYSIDLKSREKDYGNNDVALELISKMNGCNKIGWTLDLKKQTDYILFFWRDTKRKVLFPFPILRKVFMDNKDYWMKKYEDNIKIQNTLDKNTGEVLWRSQCIFIPLKLLWEKLKEYSVDVSDNCPELHKAIEHKNLMCWWENDK